MAKKNLTVKKKTQGTFLRFTEDFKKRAKIYAIENGLTLTSLITNAVEQKMKS
tara:strand:- start:3379 stop:3537 length:159 start_codon:yes stop_codon:yes gene_type:complete